MLLAGALPAAQARCVPLLLQVHAPSLSQQHALLQLQHP
jgi:hypothetical protein